MYKSDVDPTHVAEMNRLVDMIYRRSTREYGWDWERLALQAGLHYRTVKNLGQGHTVLPGFRTICLLAQAVGWNLRIVQQSRARRVEVIPFPRIYNKKKKRRTRRAA